MDKPDNAVERLFAETTPGPWRVDKRDEERWEIVGRPTWPAIRFGKKGEWGIATIDDLGEDYPKERRANARFIATAREGWPADRARADAAEAREKALREALEPFAHIYDCLSAANQADAFNTISLGTKHLATARAALGERA